MSGGGITPARSLRTTFSHNCGLIAHRGEIQFLKRQIRPFRSIVVAGHAVLIEKRALGRGRRHVRPRHSLPVPPASQDCSCAVDAAEAP